MAVKRAIISIGLILILSFSNYTISQGIRDDLSEPVVSAFKTSDAELLEIKIKASEKISEDYLTESEIKGIGQGLIDKLHIVGELEDKNKQYEMINGKKPMYNIDFIQEDNQKKLIITGKDKKDNSVKINVLTFSDKYSNLNRTELTVNIISNEIKEYEYNQRNIKNIFQKMGKDPEIKTSIVGTFNGNIKNDEKMEIVSNIMKRINAKEIERYLQPDIISISAYSPNIDNHIYTGNNKMNLNIAMRHNYTEAKTYIWIATPIISEGY